MADDLRVEEIDGNWAVVRSAGGDGQPPVVVKTAFPSPEAAQLWLQADRSARATAARLLGLTGNGN